MKYAVGIDLGGTFVKAAVVSEDGELLYKSKLPIGFSAKKQTILNIGQYTFDQTNNSVNCFLEKRLHKF